MTLFPVRLLLFAAGCYFAYGTVRIALWFRYVARIHGDLRRYPRLNNQVDEEIRDIEKSSGVPADLFPTVMWGLAVVATMLLSLAWLLPSHLGRQG